MSDPATGRDEPSSVPEPTTEDVRAPWAIRTAARDEQILCALDVAMVEVLSRVELTTLRSARAALRERPLAPHARAWIERHFDRAEHEAWVRALRAVPEPAPEPEPGPGRRAEHSGRDRGERRRVSRRTPTHAAAATTAPTNTAEPTGEDRSPPWSCTSRVREALASGMPWRTTEPGVSDSSPGPPA